MAVRIPSDQPIDRPDDTRRQLSLPLCELAVVMPVHNEAEGLERCIRSWLTVLDELATEYKLLVIDDGSTDESGVVLSRLGDHPRVVAVAKTNEGHGPTILRGYRLALATRSCVRRWWPSWPAQISGITFAPSSSACSGSPATHRWHYIAS